MGTVGDDNAWGGGGGLPCDGVAAHPGGVAIFLVASCYRNQS